MPRCFSSEPTNPNSKVYESLEVFKIFYFGNNVEPVKTLDSLEIFEEKLLEEIQANIYQKAFNFRTENTTEVNSYDEFKQVLYEKGGFISAHWDGTSETETKIKEETKATIRCIPLDNKQEEGICIVTGKPSKERVIFALAY